MNLFSDESIRVGGRTQALHEKLICCQAPSISDLWMAEVQDDLKLLSDLHSEISHTHSKSSASKDKVLVTVHVQ
jgi:hypothetical protein